MIKLHEEHACGIIPCNDLARDPNISIHLDLIQQGLCRGTPLLLADLHPLLRRVWVVLKIVKQLKWHEGHVLASGREHAICFRHSEHLLLLIHFPPLRGHGLPGDSWLDASWYEGLQGARANASCKRREVAGDTFAGGQLARILLMRRHGLARKGLGDGRDGRGGGGNIVAPQACTGSPHMVHHTSQCNSAHRVHRALCTQGAARWVPAPLCRTQVATRGEAHDSSSALQGCRRPSTSSRFQGNSVHSAVGPTLHVTQKPFLIAANLFDEIACLLTPVVEHVLHACSTGPLAAMHERLRLPLAPHCCTPCPIGRVRTNTIPSCLCEPPWALTTDRAAGKGARSGLGLGRSCCPLPV
mmetsp:Transcript_26183/g.67514  ORF Transcript_26183/g.67514 Transcript_26183/m.67514 type:complete len:356 (+) Transcript_26183:10795-11862(+)